MDYGTHVTENIVNSLLAEMDGLEELSEVVILAATNRPDLVDPALLRPGRFDKIVATALPDKETRKYIFEIHAKSMPLAKDVNLNKLAQETEGYTGADIAAICMEAGLVALRLNSEASIVTMKEFEEALKLVNPSLKEEELKHYKEIEEKYLRVARAAQVSPQQVSYFG